MRQTSRPLWIITTAGLLLAPATSEAVAPVRWGPLGHRIVAEIALARLSPAVADETRQLLGGQNITDIASWPDEHRADLPGDAPWHYVDIEVTDSSYVPARDCKQNACIISALETQLATLRDATLPDTTRGTALKWVVHLVGDLHQPLHGSDRGDRGGNDVRITFQGRPTNLHALWDSGLLLSYGQSDEEIVHQLLDEIGTRQDLAALTSTSIVQWAMESHDIARDFVYGQLPASLEITPAYADAAKPIIHERLLRGGVRLAALLDAALGH